MHSIVFVQLNMDRQNGIFVVFIQMSFHFKVLEVDLGEGEQVDISEDATDPPLVLFHALVLQCHGIMGPDLIFDITAI